jgi:glycosyltransferase involved in cell wall biosynthesis
MRDRHPAEDSDVSDTALRDPELSAFAEQSSSDRRPGLVIVSPAQTPYRLALHTRITREVPELKLWSLFTCPIGRDSWNQVTPEIGPVSFWEDPGPVPLPRHLRDWMTGGRVLRWLDQHDVGAVVLLGYADVPRLRVIGWCRSRKVPSLLWADSNIRDEPAAGLRQTVKHLLLPRVVRRFSAWLPCGIRGKEYFIKYGARPDRIFYFPNEPDYRLIWETPRERIEQVKARLGMAEGRRRLIFSGRLVPVKRVDLAIDAFSAIASRRPDWDLVIAGKGELESELKARVPAELASRVIWTGFLDQPDLSALYRACDALVLPSSYEPWALVLNEATAAGLAIIASDIVGASPELVHEGVNGVTFPSGSLKALIEALLKVTDESAIDAMKRASPGVLEEWRRVGDPVAGLRQALTSCGVIRPVGGAYE